MKCKCCRCDVALTIPPSVYRWKDKQLSDYNPKKIMVVGTPDDLYFGEDVFTFCMDCTQSFMRWYSAKGESNE